MSSLLHIVNAGSKTLFSFLITGSPFGSLLGIQRLDAIKASHSSTTPAVESQLTATHATLPLNFELNQGQTYERVKFLARSDGYVLFLTATEAVMTLEN